jgi:CRISPR system Cascade subunit CasB
MTAVHQTDPAPPGARAPSGTPSAGAGVDQVVRDLVGRQASVLQSGYIADRPAAVAALARIRRGAGKPIHATPDMWGLIDLDRLYERDEQGRALVFGTARERAENAVHAALALHAVHQQSHRDAAMHKAGASFGAAVRALMPPDGIDEPTRKRFVRAGSATSFDVLLQRLRELVTVLRERTEPLDYGLLAAQLYRWQVPERRSLVTREWGRDFHAARPAAAQAPSQPSPNDKDNP